jgi:glutathione synthase/RimK-type ligase-like ATP-grasp enzyme
MPSIALVTCRELPHPDHDLPILVQAFAHRGHRARIVEWEDGTVDWRHFDAAIVRSTWNYVARYREFIAWLDRIASQVRLINPLPTLRWNLHKGYLIELAKAGVPVVPTELVASGAHPDWNALFACHGDLVIKPAVSAGSFATIRVGRGDISSAHAHRIQHLDRDLLVQPFLESVISNGESNLVHFGGRFSHAIHKGARWAGDDEQSRGLVDPDRAELELAAHALAAAESRGHGPLAYARVDMARGPSGTPLVMELEVAEPSLFLDCAPDRAPMFVEAVERCTAATRGASL